MVVFLTFRRHRHIVVFLTFRRRGLDDQVSDLMFLTLRRKETIEKLKKRMNEVT